MCFWNHSLPLALLAVHVVAAICPAGGCADQPPRDDDAGPLGGSLLRPVENLGGEVRFRWHDELGMFGGRFSPATYNALLTRIRVWGELPLTEDVTLLAEGIYADSLSDDGFRPIDRNAGDIRNLGLEVRLTEDLSTVIGRQDFLYGAQRVVSTLDWSNIRRQFDGAKLVYTGIPNWQWDAFWGNLVGVRPFALDRSDDDVSLYGVYGVCTSLESAQIEPYYIGYENQRLGFSRHMFGGRLEGDADWLLYELEAAHQFGADAGDSVSAGFVTAGAGRRLRRLPWRPVLWLYFDYASGRGDTNRPGNTGYDEVLPLTHKYLGFIDAVLRSNVIAPNARLTMTPTEKTSLLLWYYHFRAADDNAVIPGVGTAPQVTGAGRRNLGNELDVLLQYDCTDRHSTLLGFSYFWAGNRVTTPNNDARFFYLQHTWRF